MTRKDYELIARVLVRNAMDNDTYWRGEMDAFEYGAESMRRSVARDFARVLGSDNPRFDEARFLKACAVHAPPVEDNPVQPELDLRRGTPPGYRDEPARPFPCVTQDADGKLVVTYLNALDPPVEEY